MTSTEIHDKVQELVNNFNTERFIYDLLRAYGISKTSITRLQKGDFNLAKNKDEILYKKKLFFKEVESDNLMALVDDYSKDENLKHNPRFIIITNYKEIAAKDTRTNKNLQVSIKDLPKNHTFFLPWAGQEVYTASNENEADRKASYRMAKLYDILIEENPEILENGVRELNLFFSRLLFCFFAEDTDIFPIEGMFTNTLMQHTQKDGSDVHLYLDKLFKALNTKDNSKQASYISQFPYVNGGLFQDVISIPKFNKEARNILEESGELDWSHINPDIFGSMIQAVVNPDQRGNLGMHYTSVPNIMKVIKPLFLDDLYEELEKAKGNSKKLRKLLDRISKLKIFDPACGSGNFLIIAYKELRKLEIEIWQALLETEPQQSFIYSNIQLTQFYGIEIDDFAHEIAKLSLWLAEHQMNKYFENQLELGKSNPILPLKASGNITHANATRVDWEDVCPKHKDDEIYLLGNPPYLGRSLRDTKQQEDMDFVFQGKKNYKDLDYITCWFIKGSNFLKDSNSKLAFVSTNSICQGTQVSLLWPHLLEKKLAIFFAHQSFKWNNNAKGNAGVSVVIIGLSNSFNGSKVLYSDIGYKYVQNISPYLTDSKDLVITNRYSPLSNIPEICLGNAPKDGGALIISDTEFEEYKNNNQILKYIKKYIGANEFIKGNYRYCLWLTDDDIKEAGEINEIAMRLDSCKKMRLNSKKKQTQKLASIPHKFGEIRYKKSSSVIIPSVSSERRNYIPIGFLDKNWIVSNSAFVIYDAEPWLFGIISSNMHMVWVKAVAGRLESRLRYSSQLCYNTFPFPEISKVKKANIEENVYAVLEEREKHPEKTMAELYDPDKMPKGLRQAHKDLDEAVERCYRLQPFQNDTERLEYLFKEYEKMIAKDTLFQPARRGGKQKKTRKKKVK
ncbi:class I SAM-dependent DNA methyltransferase [Psychroflexus planctonicus]|uniref:site-specific DNA-methyltransferase (adenine-specific) n=1 Tax=Psychroflexus planctonicus TaxID=1526575 RepID=A0ABQ1SFV7_9FLAO|nr:DNA methyltransferase [Psychroflexus planctonicus]GGE27445.1 putative DNA methyltransferase YeeA [Psychroflexus planctonicus]